MTLTDIHSDPRLLAEYLGIPFEPDEVIDRGPFGYGRRTRERSALECVREAWEYHRAALEEEWQKRNPYGFRYHAHFLADCLSNGVGIKRGKLLDRIKRAVELRPDIYQPANWESERDCRHKTRRP